eukprot:CAMPEP_0197843454 /NCGR_PEP_ID=MMETSP1438-20131217/339_1 /TAXON_ID=1461541 /ORGANISM="Pterosperma sp., Strain CCMP1384" /LENGTH=335 /DNA_ID=CAMNT_0043453617 /DNA_START=118 /DNA_END=1125 /DNA_ORIENTATION=-
MGTRDRPPMADYYSGGGKARMQHTQCKPAPFQTKLAYGERSAFNPSKKSGGAKPKSNDPRYAAQLATQAEPEKTDYTTTFAQSYGVEPEARAHERLKRAKNTNTDECVTREWTTTQDAIGKHFSSVVTYSGGAESGAKTVLVQKRSKVQGTTTYDPWSTTQREVGHFEKVPEHVSEVKKPEEYFPKDIDYTTTNHELMGKPEAKKPVAKAGRRSRIKEPDPYRTTSNVIGGHAQGFKADRSKVTKEKQMRYERADKNGGEEDILGTVDSRKEAEMIKNYTDSTGMAFNNFLMPGGLNRSKISKVNTELAHGAPKHLAYKVRKKLGELNMEHVLDE